MCHASVYPSQSGTWSPNCMNTTTDTHSSLEKQEMMAAATPASKAAVVAASVAAKITGKVDIRSIVDMIPTAKDELFAFQIDWAMVDSLQLLENKVRPWLCKKMVEYLGDAEDVLIDFIIKKLAEHASPKDVLEELEQVLDDDAEIFVVKMWRFLVFEVLRSKLLG